VEALVGGGRRAGGDRAALEAAAELLGDGPVVCVLGRPSLAETGDSIAAAAGALLAARPGTTFLSALRRGNVHGALDMGLAPGVLPGRIGLDDGRSRFTAAWGDLRRRRGLDAGGPRCRRRPRGASPAWCSWAPTR
jgi:NADH-quinone oxidoreductase subunit G